MKNDWALIDSERNQFFRKIKDKIFEFKEFDKEEKKWVKVVIDLTKYKTEEIENIFSEFYGSNSKKILNNYKNTYKTNEIDWVIAECIFQKESGLY